MVRDDMTIRWRDKPLDTLSRDEMRQALVDVLQHALLRPGEDNASTQPFFPTFVCGMAAGAAFCLLALAMTAL